MSLLLSFLKPKEDFCEGAYSSGPVFGPELQGTVLRLECFAGAPSCLKRAILKVLVRRVQYTFLAASNRRLFYFHATSLLVLVRASRRGSGGCVGNPSRRRQPSRTVRLFRDRGWLRRSGR